jgi:hypothetical protein
MRREFEARAVDHFLADVPPMPFASSQTAFQRPEWQHIEIWEHSRGARMNTVLNFSVNINVNKLQPLDVP